MITIQIIGNLNEIKGFLSSNAALPDATHGTTPRPELLATLKKMDDLYAFCLQYGLISFGFDAKTKQQQITEIRASVVETEAAKKLAEKDINVAVAKFTEQINAASALTSEQTVKHEKSLKEVLDSVQPHITAVEKGASEVALSGNDCKNGDREYSEGCCRSCEDSGGDI